jgi:uncharacterized protein
MEHNKKIVSDFISQSGQGDFSLLADDVSFFVAGDLPSCGMLSKQGLIDLHSSLSGVGASPFEIRTTHMIAEGNWVAAEAVSYMKLKNGKVYNNHYHLAFELRDGKIITAREYSDTDHLRRIFFEA